MKKVCLVHTVASRLSTHGCLRDFGPHGHLPRIIISMEAATSTATTLKFQRH